jgi:hypothetical protein
MSLNLRNSLSPLVVIIIMAFCDLVFADTVYLKNGEKIENATITEITPTDIKYKIGERVVVYTISKNDAIKIVYNDGSEDVFFVEAAKPKPLEHKSDIITEIDTSYITLTAGYSGLGLNIFGYNTFGYIHIDRALLFTGLGFGLVENGLVAAAADIQYNHPLPNQSYIAFGINPRLSFDGFEFIPYVGYVYNRWFFNLGYSIWNIGIDNSLSLNAGYMFENIRTERKKEKREEKSEESSTSYFRLGLELNYPVYRSEIEFFDNSFPYLEAGAGLFFRIGPEYFYLTTGAYARLDVLYKEGIVSKDFGILGINLGTVPLLDLEWSRLFVEVPLLLSFGSGQIRFTGGMLLDFYALGEVNVNVNENIPIIGGQNIISANDAEKIEDRFSEIPGGYLYTVLGLDIDIMRNWGIGVKCLILTGSLDGPDDSGMFDIEKGIEPARFKTRISTYFIF